MLILAVEDDQDYAEIIAHTLKREGHEVVTVDTIRGAVRFAERKTPHMAVLDVMLPDGTGLDLCSALRTAAPEIPVLFLSSLDRTSDVIAGLEAGADDYLAKPFHPGELIARTRALLRRAHRDAAKAAAPTERIEADGLEIDITNHLAAFNDEPMNCTPIEVDILVQLVKYPGQALSHTFLTEKVWGYKNVPDATLLKGHISSIRRKLREAGGDEETIRTVHGVGYSFTPV
jgi:two-component system response regulator MtrA